MRSRHFKIGAAAVSCGWLVVATTVACADTISVSRAQSMVASAEQNNAALLTRYPSLQAIEDVVKADCGAKVAGGSENGTRPGTQNSSRGA